ncbi:LysR family transcriptional regulator [Dasania marina]|uniref:LysR family transcriptional regulator n=1 Tax=Dasania marina TaxID=471499 RepID=UPI00035D53BA|nr:LysR family transcriptional regulator [Dasania marina]
MLGQLQDSDIKLLRVFWMVARCGSFHAAQVELNTSQATISTQIKQLEARLGRKICHRGRAGFQLTDEGRALLTCSERLFSSIDDFRNNLSEAFNEIRGELQFGIVDNLIHHPNWKLPAALENYYKIAPSVKIKLNVYAPSEIETRILDSTLQFAIISSSRKLPTLSYQTLFEEQQQLYCGKNHPLFKHPQTTFTHSDLQEHDYFNWDHLESSFTGKHKLFKENKGGSASMEAVAYAVLSGQYLGYLPEHYAQQWVDNGEMRAIDNKKLRRFMPIMLVTKKTGKLSQIAELFIKELLDLHQ